MTIKELNHLNKEERAALMARCCGAKTWIEKINDIFPVETEEKLFAEAQAAWTQCSKQDWLEAFSHHPEIGDINSLKEKFASTSAWAAGEQAAVKNSSQKVLTDLANGNKKYKEKFNYIFIVCATGKSAAEMLEMLTLRLQNSPSEEIYHAMKEQGKITVLRLKKLLSS